MIFPRWLSRLMAALGGYFWLPCPVCHESFAGFECGRYSVMESPGLGTCACRKLNCQEVAKASYERFGFRIID